ncbi:hypothetical protein IP69_06080 [Bosea sp. AAP35]|uniref:OmpA family protein n=1 Tax=Bosea sp. AAP35 TaxID=1523417 RepID=UPI0006B91B7E|nr:OmpA family protein [Bosea sp. AAP35]KPF71576.1 hypothetical protein IP69_06080 [Bosea sp. AAP35]
MLTLTFCGFDGERDRGQSKGSALLRPLVAVMLAMQLALSGTPALAQARPVAPALVSVEAAFQRAATVLFDQLDKVGGEATVVIDPLIDGVSGLQTAATRSFDKRIAALVAERYKRVTILPMSVENLAKARFIFIGTFNTINNAGQATGPRDAYWICFAVVDQQSKTVVARSAARAVLSDVDVTPAASFINRPVWGIDAATQAYIDACQRSQPGSPVAPAYLNQLQAAARISEAGQAYETGQPGRAVELYTAAQRELGGDQLRALNGLYLSYAALGDKQKADAAFGELIDRGLALGRLGVMFLFQPNSTSFNADQRVSADYGKWVQEIAARIGQSKVCLQVVGHASRTGSAAANDRLSLERARRIVGLLGQQRAEISPRLRASGVGFRETLVGLPRDDASTDVDRRVEFKAAPCA